MISEFKGCKFDFGMNFMVNKEAGVAWFLIDDNFEIFCVGSSHWEFSWLVESCIIDRDG